MQNIFLQRVFKLFWNGCRVGVCVCVCVFFFWASGAGNVLGVMEWKVGKKRLVFFF